MVSRQWLIAGCLVLATVFAAGVVYAADEPAKAVTSPKAILPEPVSKAITEAFPNAVVEKSESFEREGLVLYEVVLTEGKIEMFAYVDAAGTIDKIKSLVDAKALPGPAAATVDRLRAGAEIRKIEQIDFRSDIQRDSGKATLVKLEKPKVEFKVVIVRGEKEGHFTVSAEGKIVYPLYWKDTKDPNPHPPTVKPTLKPKK
ncbi:MAG: hypothetical protein NT049_12725 [Planctomycetota bacterium]|nr:hypothetical protein [Planctomycetota bacterium]